MNYTMNDVYTWCESQFSEHLDLLKTLASIPAPSHHEEKRAEFIKSWLETNGAYNVLLDDAKNVILPFGNCHETMLAVLAHTDVVFPDTDPIPVREENGRLYAPGIGDDTANVAALMLCARYFLSKPEMIPEPMLFVFNSCEEGLGNLKGVRQIMSDYEGRIHTLVSLDLRSDSIIARSVGSERWKVSVFTKGGHSFSDFGNANAIARLSDLITRLYRQEIPPKKGCTTTYNVGLISGGTSVNTIAQKAELTYEYRSDDRECLALMRQQFHNFINQFDTTDAEITVTSVGTRPCGGDVPENRQQALLRRCANAIQSVYPIDPALLSGSTDANIPLSMGIPAATFGLYRGDGEHTREEYVEINSLTPGLKIAMTFFLSAMRIDNP